MDPHQDASRPPCSTYSWARSIKRPLVTIRYTLWTHGRLTLSTSFDSSQLYTLKSTLSQQARRKPLGASCQQMSECSEHLRLSSTLKSTKNTFRAHIKAYISIFSPQSGHIYKKRAHCYCLSSFSSLKYILIGSPCKFKVDKFCWWLECLTRPWRRKYSQIKMRANV